VTTSLTHDTSVNIVLPKSANNTQLTPKLVTIHITSDQRYDVNNEPTNYDGLLEKLRDYYQRDAESVVVIKADQSVPYQSVISAIDAARSVGFEEFDLATQPPDPAQTSKQP
jgi:biopolymer transport protein ExbD